MKGTLGTETNDIESSTKSENLIANAPGGISDPDVENSLSVCVTPKVSWQISAVSDPCTQQLAHLCELTGESKNDGVNRPLEETQFRVSKRQLVWHSPHHNGYVE